MPLIKGETIQLVHQVQSGTDEFNRPTYTEEIEDIANCLYMPATNTDIVDTFNLTGKTIAYTVSVPKGDTHDWEDQIVIINGKRYKVFGMVEETIDALTPLSWNKKFSVERYE